VSNLSDLLPAGASGKTIEAVATANITSKAPVILNSAGTVSAVAETSIPQAVGVAGTFDASYSLPNENSVTYDSTNNKIIVTYRDSGNSSYGTASVGTISGTSISFGTPVVYNSGATNQNGATFDSVAGKVVVIYSNDASNYAGSAKIGTVSGTSISFGSVVTFTSSATFNPAPVFDTASGKVVVFFADADAGDLGKAIVGTVSGTSISFGSAVTFYSSALSYVTSTYDSANEKTIVSYKGQGTSGGKARVGTVSGTSISFGTEATYTSASSRTFYSIAYDSANERVVVAYRDNSNSDYGTAVVGTVSGTSLSFGTAVVFETAAISGYVSTTYDSSGGNIVVSYQGGASNSFYARIISGVVSGSSITFGSALILNSGGPSPDIGSAYSSTENKVVTAYNRGNISGQATVYTPPGTSTNSADFVGIADAAISSSATGTVVVQGGTVTGMSSLTTGSKYYVQDDGTVTTVSSSVNAGLAISTTSLLLNGDS
jgi:hypothetical protein